VREMPGLHPHSFLCGQTIFCPKSKHRGLQPQLRVDHQYAKRLAEGKGGILALRSLQEGALLLVVVEELLELLH